MTKRIVEFDGRHFSIVLGSDLDRDGMYLEATELADGEVAVEFFYSDQTHLMSMTQAKNNPPLALVEWMIDEAKKRLPPMIRNDQP